jgi:hypothetical protein
MWPFLNKPVFLGVRFRSARPGGEKPPLRHNSSAANNERRINSKRHKTCTKNAPESIDMIVNGAAYIALGLNARRIPV